MTARIATCPRAETEALKPLIAAGRPREGRYPGGSAGTRRNAVDRHDLTSAGGGERRRCQTPWSRVRRARERECRWSSSAWRAEEVTNADLAAAAR